MGFIIQFILFLGFLWAIFKARKFIKQVFQYIGKISSSATVTVKKEPRTYSPHVMLMDHVKYDVVPSLGIAKDIVIMGFPTVTDELLEVWSGGNSLSTTDIVSLLKKTEIANKDIFLEFFLRVSEVKVTLPLNEILILIKGGLYDN